MESMTTSTVFLPALCVVTTPRAQAAKGTGVSAAMRYRTTVAPTSGAAVPANAIALLPISDVVDVLDFDVFAGIRSWSPPV